MHIFTKLYINVQWAQLVLGWMTVLGFISLDLTNHPGQLSLAIPLWVGTISTGQRVVMLCSWGVKAGRPMARGWWWQVKLREALYNTCHI